MIKKLRRSFIITAMLSVTAVLVVIVAVMNIANFINSDTEADELLKMLSENGGSFMPFMQMNGNQEPPVKPEDGEEPPEKPEDGSEPPEMPEDSDNSNFLYFRRNKQDGGFGRRDIFTEETPYETRFFTVEITGECEPVRIDTGSIAAVSTDEALEMAQRLYSEGKLSGYENNYKYLAKQTDGKVLYVFIDRTRSLKSVTDFMVISLLVSLGAAAAIFLLVFIFSKFAIRPIAESYEKQKRFITDAGHELKTPLAVINSCNEVIELEQGETKWTRSIAAQTEKLSELTKELVALARMDEGSSQLTFEEFPLSETVNEILDPFALMAERKGIAFTADIQPDITCKGDRNSLGRLCSIMADNALKYTPEGGYIKFGLSAKNRKVTLYSENTAEDTEKGTHPELFDRFRRGDSSHNGDIPGYGIGLSMAQSIAAAHNGKIEAFSKDGKSLTITVKI